MSIHHVPNGFNSVTPFLTVEGADRLLTFISRVFESREVLRADRGDGTIANARVLVEGSMVEVSEASPEWPALNAALHVFVRDVDTTYRKAMDAGATPLFEPTDMPWGAREAAVQDAHGISWYLGTNKEA